MRAIGHAILGDPKYGDEKTDLLDGGLKLQLHARSIVLPHPIEGTLTITAPLSPEMKAGFDKFGFVESEAPFEPFPPQPRRRRD